jgi:small subunit ribosomal protein S1
MVLNVRKLVAQTPLFIKFMSFPQQSQKQARAGRRIMDESENIEDLDKKYIEDGPSAEFASLLKQENHEPVQKSVVVGQKVSGTIQKIDSTSVFIDFGGRSEAVIDLQEMRDASGEHSLKEGDTLQAYVASLEGEIRLTKSLKSTNRDAIQDAFDGGVPIDGRVTGFNKGGLVVNLGGLRAFCPLSQIEMGFCSEPESYAGKTLSFKILELKNGGRNIVVSHRALLEADAAVAAKALRETLIKGDERKGQVRRVERFGAFVDIGGLEGLVHVSEISHTRVNDPSTVIKPGDEVTVKIIDLKDLGTEKERISLSLKALEADPWTAISESVNEGQVITGKVVSLQPFGAFVEVIPGIEGLVHISQITAEKRINSPSEILTMGQEVQARVQQIDKAQHRISLSIRAVAEGEEQAAEAQDMSDFQAKEKEMASGADNVMAEALRKAGLT